MSSRNQSQNSLNYSKNFLGGNFVNVTPSNNQKLPQGWQAPGYQADKASPLDRPPGLSLTLNTTTAKNTPKANKHVPLATQLNRKPSWHTNNAPSSSPTHPLSAATRQQFQHPKFARNSLHICYTKSNTAAATARDAYCSTSTFIKIKEDESISRQKSCSSFFAEADSKGERGEEAAAAYFDFCGKKSSEVMQQQRQTSSKNCKSPRPNLNQQQQTSEPLILPSPIESPSEFSMLNTINNNNSNHQQKHQHHHRESGEGRMSGGFGNESIDDDSNRAPSPNGNGHSNDSSPKSASPQYLTEKPVHAVVKQVLSGDTFIVFTNDNKAEGITLKLFNIYAPKLARKPTSGWKGNFTNTDEPFAWESREFLRELIVGRKIQYEVRFKMDDYRIFVVAQFVDHPNQKYKNVSINDMVLRNGCACLKSNISKNEDLYRSMKSQEDIAVSTKKGIFGNPKHSIRKNIVWNVELLNPFFDIIKSDSSHSVIIEQIIDAGLVRALFIKNQTWYYFLLKIAGIKAPLSESTGATNTKAQIERLLLQRKVTFMPDSTWANQYILGMLTYNKVDCALYFLKHGYAQYDESSIRNPMLRKKYSEMSTLAQKENTGLWINGHFNPVNEVACKNGRSTKTVNGLPINFSAKVLEVGPGDSLMVQNPEDQAIKRIFFSSTIFPKRLSPNLKNVSLNSSNKVFIVPYCFEARELLRKKYFEKTLNFSLDYIVEANNYAPERICCTVTYENTNIACELISKGLALCMKHRKDDRNRSQCYSALIEAENHAMSRKLGVHSSTLETRASKCIDMSHSIDQVKPLLYKLQQLGKTKAIIETVLTPVRFRIYLQELNILVSFIIEGLVSPKNSNSAQENDKYFSDAVQFSRTLCLNRDAEVDISSIDRGGNLIGNMNIDNHDIAVSILSNGYGYINWNLMCENVDANRTKRLSEIQMIAKSKKMNIWNLEGLNIELPNNCIEQEIPNTLNIENSRLTNYNQCMISDIRSGLGFSIQLSANKSVIHMIYEALNSDSELNDIDPQMVGRGSFIAAQDIDNQWYRTQVLEFESDDSVLVRFIDYGNTKVVNLDTVKEIPTFLSSLAPQSKPYNLAFVYVPALIMNECFATFKELVCHQVLLMNVEYCDDKGGDQSNLSICSNTKNIGLQNNVPSLDEENQTNTVESVSLLLTEENIDVISSLLAQGLVVLYPEISTNKDNSFNKILNKYRDDQELAKKSNLGYWKKLNDFDSF